MSKKDRNAGKPDNSRPPKPSTGCTLCDYVWVGGRWVPSWNSNCTVHPSPSDLL